MSDTATLIEKALTALEAAKTEVEGTEEELLKVLSETTAGKRAEKVSVSATIENALQRLRTARKKVLDAEEVLASERDAKRLRSDSDSDSGSSSSNSANDDHANSDGEPGAIKA